MPTSNQGATRKGRSATAKKKTRRKAERTSPEPAAEPEISEAPVFDAGPRLAPMGTLAADSAVEISPDKIPVHPDKPKMPYWVGTLPHSPIQNATIGPISFPRQMGGINEKGEMIGPMGQKTMLDEDQVAHIMREVGRRVVRKFGTETRTLEVDNPLRKYVPQRDDRPLGLFLYMHRLPPENPSMRPAMPVPMIRAPEAAPEE